MSQNFEAIRPGRESTTGWTPRVRGRASVLEKLNEHGAALKVFWTPGDRSWACGKERLDSNRLRA
jgi:hypothetical protein